MQPLQAYVPPPQPLSPPRGFSKAQKWNLMAGDLVCISCLPLNPPLWPREGNKACGLRVSRSLQKKFSIRKSERNHRENRKLASEGNDKRHAATRPLASRDLLKPFFPFIQFQQNPCKYATRIPKLNHSLSRQPKITFTVCVQLQDQGLSMRSGYSTPELDTFRRNDGGKHSRHVQAFSCTRVERKQDNAVAFPIWQREGGTA